MQKLMISINHHYFCVNTTFFQSSHHMLQSNQGHFFPLNACCTDAALLIDEFLKRFSQKILQCEDEPVRDVTVVLMQDRH